MSLFLFAFIIVNIRMYLGKIQFKANQKAKDLEAVLRYLDANEIKNNDLKRKLVE